MKDFDASRRLERYNILFISHDASQTGAPFFLLHFLRWLKKNTSISFRILLRNGGPLQKEFEALAPTEVFNKQKKGLIARTLHRITPTNTLKSRALKNRLPYLKTRFLNEKFDLIYSNTIANGEVLESLRFLRCPIIQHIHELESNIQVHTKPEILEQTKQYTSNYAACSQAVKDNLIQNHQIPSDKITLIYAFVSPKQTGSNKPQCNVTDLRNSLGIPEEAHVVCACGGIDWRKGTDLFIQLARIMNQKLKQDVFFIWVGGNTKGSFFTNLRYDISKLNLDKYMRFVGAQENPYEYFSLSDVFILMSREDPFPLVCLEAASTGKPIVCFDKAGGMKEFVEDDCGFVVPYLDIEVMAEKVITLLESEDLRQKFGENAQTKVLEAHTSETVAPKMLEFILQTISF